MWNFLQDLEAFVDSLRFYNNEIKVLIWFEELKTINFVSGLCLISRADSLSVCRKYFQNQIEELRLNFGKNIDLYERLDTLKNLVY